MAVIRTEFFSQGLEYATSVFYEGFYGRLHTSECAAHPSNAGLRGKIFISVLALTAQQIHPVLLFPAVAPWLIWNLDRCLQPHSQSF